MTISRTDPVMLHVQSLLQHAKRVQNLNKLHDKGRDGGNFNLFHLLGIGHLEVSTHSPILRDLLDPHGSHGQGAVFLRRFVDCLGLPSFDFEKAEVASEVGIGAVTEECGGRLDLVIGDGTTEQIIIENKIFAGEQDNWVTRYLNHAPGAKLVFLTLDGKEPGNIKKGSRPPNLVCASYREHITGWLHACRKEAATAPIVRESITQYLHLIQELTHQNPEPYMNEELVKAATENQEALKAFYGLRDAERGVQAAIVRHIQDEMKFMADRHGFAFKGQSNFDYSATGSGFEFTNTELDSIGLRIRFQFDKSGYRDFAFGFADNGKLLTEAREMLKKLFAEVYAGPLSSPTWPAWIYWSKYQNWPTVFPEIRFGKFVADVERVVIKTNEIAMQFSKQRHSSA